MKTCLIRLALGLGVAALPVAATAQMEDRFFAYADTVIACFAEAPAEARGQCIGKGLDACLTAEGDETTLGIVACLNAETLGWDEIVQGEYDRLLTDLTVRDGAYPPGVARLSRAATFGAAQHAWKSWVDAECLSLYAEWQDGTIRSVKAADCRRLLTADRAIDLRERREPEQ